MKPSTHGGNNAISMKALVFHGRNRGWLLGNSIDGTQAEYVGRPVPAMYH